MGSKTSSKRVLAVLLVVLCGLAVGVAGAGADAADPVLASTTGSVVTNADGSRTVTVQGAWAWTTHKSNCSQDKRAVGRILGVFRMQKNPRSVSGRDSAQEEG